MHARQRPSGSCRRASSDLHRVAAQPLLARALRPCRALARSRRSALRCRALDAALPFDYEATEQRRLAQLKKEAEKLVIGAPLLLLWLRGALLLL